MVEIVPGCCLSGGLCTNSTSSKLQQQHQSFSTVQQASTSCTAIPQSIHPVTKRMCMHIRGWRYSLLMNLLALEIRAFVCSPPRWLAAQNHIFVPTAKLRQFISVGDPFNHACGTSACHLLRVNGDALGTSSIVGNLQINAEEDNARHIRKERLHHHLNKLGIDADLLEEAAFCSVTTTGEFTSFLLFCIPICA